jgi:hypothetical protein
MVRQGASHPMNPIHPSSRKLMQTKFELHLDRKSDTDFSEAA